MKLADEGTTENAMLRADEDTTENALLEALATAEGEKTYKDKYERLVQHVNMILTFYCFGE